MLLKNITVNKTGKNKFSLTSIKDFGWGIGNLTMVTNWI